MGRVLFVACTNVGQAMIRTICGDENIKTQVVGIVNLNAQRSLSKANYYTYLDIAAEYDIPLHFCNNVNDPETVAWIAEKEPDIIIQTGWSQKFREPLLNLPRFGCIGEHPAPLPRGRGAACVNWAILTGETQWGDTFFHMVNEYDRGDVYAQEMFTINEYDDVRTVYDKVALCSAKMVREHIDRWSEGVFNTVELDESIATYYKKRTPADGVFDFTKGAKELHDFIRAQTEPYPGAFFWFHGEKITVLASRPTGIVSAKPAGTVLGTTNDGGIRVVCGDGKALDLLRYRREDGSKMWMAEDSRFTGVL